MRSQRAEWRAYFVLGAGAFLALYLPQPILPILDAAFHTRPVVTGLTMTVALVGFAVSGLLPEGDPERTLRRALWLIVGGSALAAVSPVIVVLFVARGMQGVGVGLVIAGALSDVAKRHSAKVAGTLTGAVIAGTAIGGFASRLLGYMAIFTNWRVAFAVDGVVVLAAMTYALPALRSGEPIASTHLPHPRLPWGLICGGLGILLVNIGMFDLLPYRLEGAPFHLPQFQADLVYLAFIPAVFTAGLAGWAVDRIGARRVVVIAVALGGTLMLTSLWTSVSTTAVAAVASIGATTAIHTCYSGAAASHGRGAVGRYLAAYYMGGAAGAPIAAAAFQAWGWTGALVVLLTAWVLVAAIAIVSRTSTWQGGDALPI
ncbi:MAG: MFS transporter [Candidatus Dormibacteria bacterium]